MSVRVEVISLKPELTTGTTDYGLGQIFAKIVATLLVIAEWFIQGDLTQEPYFTGNSVYWITYGGGAGDSAGLNWFQEGFKVGDSVKFSNASTSFATTTRTITAISADGLTLTFSGAAFVSSVYVGATRIEGVTECTGMNFRYNLIENINDTETFLSKIDGNELKYSKGGISYLTLTDVDLIPQGMYASNHLGSAQVKGNGNLNEFVITHTFYVNPFYLVAHLSDILQGKAPEYFFDLNTLRYIYNIELLYNLSDPNRVHTSNADTFLLGNMGWFNENFNGGIPKFTQDPIIFKVGGVASTYADFEGVTDVEITVRSVDGVFVNGSTDFIINHIILPEDEEEYVNTATDVTTNFMFDRAFQTLGAAAVNGDNFGGVKQVLKNISALFISANEMLITAQIDLSSEYRSRIDALTDKQMLISVTTQDHTKSTALSDIVACLDAIHNYDTNLANEGVGDITTVFNFFPDITVTSPTAGVFSEDTLRGDSIIGVDIANGALVRDMSVIIRCEKTTGESFELEQKDFSFAGAIVQAGIQQINIEQPRGFILHSSNPFYNYSLKRRADLDSGSVVKYQLIYPFKIRWEDFIQLATAHADFYDVAEKFNGFNQEWSRYFDGLGWTIKYVIRARIEEAGFENTVALESDLIAYDYEEATDWTQEIKIFDIAAATEIPNNILSDKIVEVRAIFTKIAGALPAIGDVAGMIEWEPFEQGGINKIKNINTVYIHENGSEFISVLGNKLLKKEKAANVYTFTANIDGRLLTGQPKLSSRIYDLTVPPFGASKEFQDADGFDYQDGVAYDFQDA